MGNSAVFTFFVVAHGVKAGRWRGRRLVFGKASGHVARVERRQRGSRGSEALRLSTSTDIGRKGREGNVGA